MILFCSVPLLLNDCSKNKDEPPADHGTLQLQGTIAGGIDLKFGEVTKDIPIDRNFVLKFSASLDTEGIENEISIRDEAGIDVDLTVSFLDNNHSVSLDPLQNLKNGKPYSLIVSSKLTGASGETFAGYSYAFITLNGKVSMQTATINGENFLSSASVVNINPARANIEVSFTEPLDPSTYSTFVSLTGGAAYTLSVSADSMKILLSTEDRLVSLKKYTFTISSGLTAANGFTFSGYSNAFYTAIDSVYKFPVITDQDLLTMIQKQTFAFFWDYAHPDCGMARERLGSGDVVTTGGSGFGIMAMIVGVERGFITRQQALDRMDKMLTFLETCDRFHGAWPHWINGSTGITIPFSASDDGGDLVETTFLIQGLLTFRQYLQPSVPEESGLIDRINTLWHSVEYDFYTRGEEALYWHWSPTTGWTINLKLQGYNETMICYVLGIGSPDHSIPATSYFKGYLNSGSILNGNEYYGYVLPEGQPYGGPLFFTHYSFLGLNPQNLRGPYINFWEQNVNHSLINWAYCADNPKKYAGYSATCWGLTASDGYSGYSAHSPTNDRGVITPTAAVSSLPYTPEQSMDAIRTFYYFLGDKLWGPYGFYDAFSPQNDWYADSYLSIDQGPEIVMIENYRTGLLWNLFMSCPEVTSALTKMGFSY